MTKIARYISPSCISYIRNAIIDAGGNEVFFVGKTNKAKIVDKVQVVARGNEFAVPVVQQLAEPGDVIVHNHPSGSLQPSTNDMYIAQEFSGFGIASYIVNNNVDDIYAIIEPLSADQARSLDIKKLERTLGINGPIAKILTGYEFRPEQLNMVKAVGEAFNEDKIAVIEAATGVGKSLAYLIPAIFWALRNKERCVISTNTINLQEQLIKKDIPFLQKALNLNFNAVLVKGRYNYLCLRKVDELKREPELLLDDGDQTDVQALMSWAENTKDGSRADLNFVPNHSVWEKVAAESDTCTHSRCPFYKKCFVTTARKRANTAHVLVVNHHLLFSDLAVRAAGAEVAVLPPYKRLIFDEAHHLEDIATQYFGGSVTRIGTQRIISRLHRFTKGKAKGYLSLLVNELKKVKRSVDDPIVDEFIKKLQTRFIPTILQMIDANDAAMDVIFNIVYMQHKADAGEMKLRITGAVRDMPLWKTVATEKSKQLISNLNQFTRELLRQIELLEDSAISLSDDLYSHLFTIRAQCNRLKQVVDTIYEIVFQDDTTNIRWIEIKPQTHKHITRLRISPLDISDMMIEQVFEKFPTIIMTSATLTVSGIRNWQPFDFIGNRLGFKAIKRERLRTYQFKTPFNYQEQAIIGIPTNIPLPDHTNFPSFLSTFILKAVAISDGRAFVLFTSYRLMKMVYSQLETELSTSGWTPLIQGSMSRHQLLSKFKEATSSVLFATDSFWEGVDVQGKALENIILTKLPFKVPSEPVMEARVEAIEKGGGNPFMEYSLPQAVIKTKQGVGRLIRNQTDRGSIWILDKRIVEKFYGKIFISSLPNCPIKIGNVDEILSDIREFFTR